MTRPRRIAGAATFALLGWAALGLAQLPGKAKDDALDDLLKQVEKAARKDSPADPKGKAKEKPKPGPVDSKDKDLDSLLLKLGQSKDNPSADGKKPEPPPEGDGAPPPKPDADKGPGKDKEKKPSAGSKGMSPEDQELEDKLAGRKKKPRPGQRQQVQGQSKDGEDGPLGDLIKEMRDVEGRLGKPDTGDETRQKQGEIVKKLETIIEQYRTVQTQQQMLRQLRQGKQPGKPGQGDQTGALAQGAPPMLPKKPNPKRFESVDRDPWGHLPPELRIEMENAFKEDFLPSKEDLIKRYYLSVDKKSLSRGD